MTDTNSQVSAPATTDPQVRNRLWLMMFLLYAVYGLWFPIAARFLSASPDVGGLGFTDAQIGAIIAVAGAIGALCAPFIAGQIADRYFSTEKCLGVLLILGGAIKWYTGFQTSYVAWLWLSIAYAVLFMPTLGMTNSLAMTHLANPKREFPGVRVWGTIGWIVVAWAFPMVWLESNLQFQALPPFFKGDPVENQPARMIDSVKVAGLLSMVLGVYCWAFLPSTPPKRDAAQKLAFARAFSLVRRPSFAVYLGCALVISVVHTVYFLQMSKFLPSMGLRGSYIMPAMSLGQFSEIAVMAALGLALTRFGFRVVITVGALSYALRYFVFGTTSLPLSAIIGAQLFHGFCFAGFYAAGFIYVDRLAPRDIKASAQTVIMLVLFGLGPITAGKFVNPMLAKACTPPPYELKIHSDAGAPALPTAGERLVAVSLSTTGSPLQLRVFDADGAVSHEGGKAAFPGKSAEFEALRASLAAVQGAPGPDPALRQAALDEVAAVTEDPAPAGKKLDYSKFWYALGVAALLAAIALAVFFRDESENAPGEPNAPSAS